MTKDEAVSIIEDRVRVTEYVESSYVDCVDIEPLKMAIEALRQPEIIYCKDCKYWREHKYAKETKKYIPFCGFNAIYTKSDDFCSRAERREE